MTFAFDQSAFIDLALCVALLTIPGTLLMALFLERRLDRLRRLRQAAQRPAVKILPAPRAGEASR